MNIPFNDLKSQYETIQDEINGAITRVIQDSAFIRGQYVTDFENEFAQMNRVSHCISCANGTDAIYLVLRALGIGPGDEVITTALSWISSSETITQTGATVVFADIDPDFYTIAPERIAEKITSRTKAVIAVHLYGQMAEIQKIKEICDSHGLFLIEDCAQSHFSQYRGNHAGTFGIAGTFSFYPGKNLGAYGDAGAIITNDAELAHKTRMLANHGSLVKHQHQMEGVNSRMDGIQSAILSVKLKHIDRWTKRRTQIAQSYHRLLHDEATVQTPAIRTDTLHTFHLYVIRSKKRDALRNYLLDQGIETGIHYPTPLPLLQAYARFNHTPDHFPLAWTATQQILSLPIYPEMKDQDIVFITEKIKAHTDYLTGYPPRK